MHIRTYILYIRTCICICMYLCSSSSFRVVFSLLTNGVCYVFMLNIGVWYLVEFITIMTDELEGRMNIHFG
ncbi:hypothetical protein L2E82_26461 [Cichorium intybus]|uniref:Uncharacterized protein n=1 Tax=Cichorium intybus TaxID=13427 RepID=A0ACB9CQP9_CICIN|nr:hypothetical protein L2E82_26461 [Cichorium intybus]